MSGKIWKSETLFGRGTRTPLAGFRILRAAHHVQLCGPNVRRLSLTGVSFCLLREVKRTYNHFQAQPWKTFSGAF